jgi:hypothetical protein
VAVTILTPAAVYAWVGALQAVSVAAAIGITLLIGHFVDKQFGRLMLRAGALLMALFNVLRMFITQFAGALALNVSYELASAANHIPISKGFYDEADDDDTRLAYVAVVAYFDSLLKFLAWLAVFLLAVYAGDNAAFYGGFAIAGAAALFTMKERYKALDKRSFDRWNAFSRG